MWPNFFQHKKKSNPGRDRFDQTLESFDLAQGYQRYHEQCQSLFTQASQQERSILQEKGVEHLTILNPSEAATFLREALALADKTIAKPEIDYSEIILVQDPSFLQRWFQKIFHPTLHQQLLNYFGSEYLIYWHTLLKAKPAETAIRSFLWHCDKGPSCHVKILLYLNDFSEHQGSTIFLDRLTTRQFGKAGYVFGSVKKREEDLSELAQQHNIAFHPQGWEMKAGEGIIFEPSQVLHKGILPSIGPRYVLAFCLLPSSIPWQAAFSKNNYESFSQGYNWSTTPQELTQQTKS